MNTLDRSDAGFTLIEVVIASAIFVFVAITGFETLRQLGSMVSLLAQRSAAAAAENVAVGRIRSDAASASAVWLPTSACGAAVSMMRRDAAGTSFATYVVRSSSLIRLAATGPIDPCNATLTGETALANVDAMAATSFAVTSLSAHLDPISGHADGTFVRSDAPAVSVNSHVADFNGATIPAGNTLVEVDLDVDPAEVTIDLVAGNRPSGYTNELTYACGARCATNGLFPEISGLAYDSCTQEPPDLPDDSASYVAASTALGSGGRIVTSSYTVRLRYGFTFTGDSPTQTVYREGPSFVWPAAANLSDPYPVDYTGNAVRAMGASAFAASAGAPSNLTAEIDLCAGIDAESLFHG